MHASARFSLTGLMAALLLAAAVSHASARNLSVSHQNFRVTWTSLELEGGVTVRCRVTLEGSFHARTIPKVARSLIGAITRAISNELICTNGQGRPRTETLPWHVTYEGFAGTLPNISAVFLLLSRLRFNLTVLGLCTGDYGTAANNVTTRTRINAGGEVTELEPVTGRNRVTLHSGAAFCSASGTVSGIGNVFPLGTTSTIRVTLI